VFLDGLASRWDVQACSAVGGTACALGDGMATLEELQRELDALRHEVRLLREQSAEPATDDGPRILSRRNLLRAAPLVAVGTAVAAMSASPAAAAVGDPVVIGHSNVGGSSTTTLTAGTPPPGLGEPTPSGSAPALSVSGGLKGDWFEADGIAVGTDAGAALVVGADFLFGNAAIFHGAPLPVLHGEQGVDAVLIDAIGDGTALTVNVTDGAFIPPIGDATVLAGTGIAVTSNTGLAIDASGQDTVVNIASESTGTKQDALTISYAGTSRALYAESTSATNINGTITGVNDGHGIGLWGEQRNNTGTGFGVVGVGGALGRGARLSGGAAALQILPSSAATHPSTGKAGDLFVDASVRLWFCQKASSGAVAAVWKQIA
jgi:hypothetical protein